MPELADSHPGVLTCADGARLRYSTAGSGEPVVLVHGFSLDQAMWDPQWAAIGSRHRAIRYDLRGFGASTLPEGPYSHVRDLVALLDALGARPAHVVGLSMGGGIATELALEEPRAVRSLTLVDSVLGGFRMSDAWGARWRDIVAMARGGDVDGAKRMWAGHELFGSVRPKTAAALAPMLERYSGWHWRNRDPVVPATRAAIERLAEIAVPTLVVVGERDLPDYRAIATCLATTIPGARLEVVAFAGHLPNLDAPEAFNALLLAHLAAADAPAA